MGIERYSQGATCWDAKRRSRIKTGRIYHISSHRRQQLLIHEKNIMSFVHKCKCICCQILQLLYFYVRIPGSCPLDIGCGSDEGGTSKGQMHRIHLWHAVTAMWYVQRWAERWAFFSCEIFVVMPCLAVTNQNLLSLHVVSAPCFFVKSFHAIFYETYKFPTPLPHLGA